MTNLISKNKLPNREEFVTLYMGSHKVSEIAVIYQTTKKRIRKWACAFELSPRVRGGKHFGGNHKKYNFNSVVLLQMVNEGLTHKVIANLLGIKNRTLADILNRMGIYKKYNTPAFTKYARRVRCYTEKIYRKHKIEINPNNLVRSRTGTLGGYQLDHKIGIRKCFDCGLSVEECAEPSNLRIITWEENLEKRYVIS